ncbi:MAG: 23S rRNA (pseudouridine(1915)-N(3))-methyltransferase RlmH [Cyanobacteria bacterium P01_A01_bin.17]
MSAFPKVKLIAVGKVKKGWIRQGLEMYVPRLPELEIQEIKDSSPDKEGEQLLSRTTVNDSVVALSEAGKTYTSVDFAHYLSQAPSNRLVFMIGSAEGLSDLVKQKSALQFSLSPMTFPHELARLMLVEQLYRAKNILQGGNYHK